MSDSAPNVVAINLNLTLADHLKSEIFFCKALFAKEILFGFICIGLGAAVGGFMSSRMPFFLFSLIGIAVALLPAYYLLRVRRDWYRDCMPKEILVTVSDSGLVYSIGDDYRETSPWSEVDVSETGAYFFLWSGKYRLPMPKRCFTTEQMSAFVDALDRNKGPAQST